MKKTKGFTIIEVVLVLAIAGLIFLVVFLALPQLQRSQRDSTRKSQVGRLVAGLQQYASNNNGSLPAESTNNSSRSNFGAYGSGTNAFFPSYMNSDGDFVDPKTGDYTVVFPATAPDSYTPNDGELAYWLGITCDGTSASRAAAVMIALEQGTYCEDIG